MHVAILIVCYNGKHHLAECLPTVLSSEDPGLTKRIVVVDNASSDGSAAFVRERFPQVEVLEPCTNLGFAGGNNLGWAHIRRTRPAVRYVMLLNQDTLVRSGFLRALVDYLEANPQVGCAQPKILLHPRTERFNTAGNRSHYLGFGFTTAYNELDRGQHDRPASIDFASGAAVMVRAELLERVGLFDDVLFMYLEDAELGWKLRQVGYDSAYVPASVVYHKYEFRGDYRHYHHLERNRWWLLLAYYRLPTLLLLAPALGAMEAGQWIFALRHGLLRQRLRVYGFFARPANLRLLWRHRREAQRRRTVGDRPSMTRFAGRFDFEGIQGPLVRWVANPLFGGYWWVVRRLIWW